METDSPFVMYAVIYRDDDLLGHYQPSVGNFRTVVPELVSVLPKDHEDQGGLYKLGSFRFLYVRALEYLYGVVISDVFPYELGFAYLQELSGQFMKQFYEKAPSALRLELQFELLSIFHAAAEKFRSMESEDALEAVERVPDYLRKIKMQSAKSVLPVGKNPHVYGAPSLYRAKRIYQLHESENFKEFRVSWASRHQTLIIVLIGIALMIVFLYVFLISVLLGTWPNLLNRSDYNLGS
eukprot:ANDGO_03858.mRNA.1 Vesicle-associated membrane protein 714